MMQCNPAVKLLGGSALIMKKSTTGFTGRALELLCTQEMMHGGSLYQYCALSENFTVAGSPVASVFPPTDAQ